MNMIRSIIMALAFVLFTAGTAVADGGEKVQMGDITLPTETTIQDDDLSNILFRSLLGSAWTAVAGEATVADRYGDKTSEDAKPVAWGQFSGLLPKILEISNMAAMAMISSMLIYMAAVFCLTTAHEGRKLGGSKFNSMWIPVRGTIGFGLSVPVAGGLSLLQVATIACVCLGVNLANYTWGKGVSYIVSNIDTSVSAAAPPAIDNEARELIQPAFQSIVAQEALKAWAKEDDGDEPPYPNRKLKGESTGALGGVSVQGDYVIEHRAAEGRLVLWFMPGKRMALGSMGGISIPAPVYNAADLKDARKKAEYDAMLAVSYARLEALFAACESLREHARYHISNHQIIEKGSVPKPQVTGQDIADTYKTQVVTKAAPHIEFLAKSSSSGQKLATALGVKADGVPAGGWMTAGVLPFVLATAQSQFDMYTYNGGLQFVLMLDGMPGDSTDGKSKWSNFLEYIGYHTLLHWEQTSLDAVKYATTYATQTILAGRVYTGHSNDGDSAGLINRGITKAFFGGQLNNSGMLSTTLSAFASMNPISAMVWFGDRMVTIGMQAIGVSVIGNVAGMVTGQSWVSQITSNPILMFLMGAVIVAGGTFCYVVPAYFMLIFFEALWPWIVAVVETLIAGPLWAASHAMPEGEGFAGQHARRGYVKLIDISIRPFLLVCAVFATYITIQAAAWIIYQVYALWANGVETYQGMTAVGQFISSIIVASTVFLATRSIGANFFLKMPGQVIAWIGGVGFNMGNAEQNAASSTHVVGGVIGSVGRTSGNLGGTMGGGSGKGGGGIGDKKDKGDKGGDKKADLPNPISEKKD